MTSNFNESANVKQFSAALGNGQKALQHVLEAAIHVKASNDATVIARLMDKASQKGDSQAVKAVRLVTESIWQGARFTLEAGKPASIKLKGASFQDLAFAALELAVAEKVSLRGSKLIEMLRKATTPAEDATATATATDAPATATVKSEAKAQAKSGKSNPDKPTAEEVYALICAMDAGEKSKLLAMMQAAASSKAAPAAPLQIAS